MESTAQQQLLARALRLKECRPLGLITDNVWAGETWR